MTIIGIILMIIGFGTALVVFMGLLPESMSIIAQQPAWIFIVVGIIGAVLVYFNRRPHD
ncbi:MAG TPA: hypothetical protein PLX23_12355 [Candidatus Hydrogenedens sp.]|nr:hypothetical protein [Candidatus Hydrogenedens sp.]